MAPNKTLIYKSIPNGFPVKGKDLTIETHDVDLSQSLPTGGLLLQNLYASLDPYLRGRMRDPAVASYAPAFTVGEALSTYCLAKVVESEREGFKKGDLVGGMLGVQEYVVLGKVEGVKKIANEYGLDPMYYLGPMGMPGMTAYSGLYEIGKPKRGETIFISAASGAVGQIVGALARDEGLRVIGSVGSDDKLEYTTKTLKFDGCFNYKKEEASDALKRLCPDGIDIYWDNVGGPTLQSALDLMNNFGRIVVCGMISQYNNDSSTSPFQLGNLLSLFAKRLTIRGFIQGDPGFADKYAKERDERLGPWLKEDQGKMPVKMSVTRGVENGVEALLGLFKGENFGKAVLQIGDP